MHGYGESTNPTPRGWKCYSCLTNLYTHYIEKFNDLRSSLDKKFPLQCFTDKKRSEESYKVISVITSHEYNITKLIWGGFFRKGIQNGLKRMGSKNYIKRDRAINLIRENLQKIEESLKSAEKVVSEASDFSIQPDYSQSQKPMTEHLSYLKFV